jgi:adenylate kinase family enzyme
MSFDFSTAINDGKARMGNKSLALILLGASGNGKSRACGTLGVKTLYIHTSTEQHGADSAAAGGSEILPVCLDKVADKQLTPDEAYDRLLALLGDSAGIKKLGVGAIVLDGLSELEALIMSSDKFKKRVQVELKGVTSYSGDIQRDFYHQVFTRLNLLRDTLGLHYVVTCALNVVELSEILEILEATPKLYGYQMAENITRWFPDILVIGQMKGPSGAIKPRLQFQALVSKDTKDQKTKARVKLHNIFIRITGVDMSTLPETLAPDLAKIAAIKAAGTYTE